MLKVCLFCPLSSTLTMAGVAVQGPVVFYNFFLVRIVMKKIPKDVGAIAAVAN